MRKTLTIEIIANFFISITLLNEIIVIRNQPQQCLRAQPQQLNISIVPGYIYTGLIGRNPRELYARCVPIELFGKLSIL
jgi:hypothetical protein